MLEHFSILYFNQQYKQSTLYRCKTRITLCVLLFNEILGILMVILFKVALNTTILTLM
jgi:hypothetical protein